MSTIRNLPFRAYRDDPGINNTLLKCYAKSPLLCYKRFFAPCRLPEDADSAPKLIGRAAHCLALEGQKRYEEQFTVRPVFYEDANGARKDWNGNARYCREWSESHGDKGIEVLAPKENQLVERLVLSLEENEDCVAVLESGEPEVTLRNVYQGQPIKGRLDWFDRDRRIVADLKTVDDLDNFEDQVRRKSRRDSKHYYYYRQLAWYRALLTLEYGAEAAGWSYVLLAVEKQEPFRSGVYELGAKLLDLGDRENDEIFRELLASIHTGYWPGGPKGIQKVELPEAEQGIICA